MPQPLRVGVPMDKEMSHKFKPIQRHGIYLLPNLLTTAGLFSAFYSIVAAMKGYFDVAAIAIFIAMVFDTLDGRVARLTNSETAFGAQYDSLSDMLAFGLAPALVVYSWSLSQLGKAGWLVAFLYTAATGLRLARFNTQTQDHDRRYFQGLPCPAAAGVVAGMVWFGSLYELNGNVIAYLAMLLTVFVSALMVSTFRYHSFKQMEFKGKVSFLAVVILVFLIVGMALQPTEVLFGVFFLYACWGLFFTWWQKRKMRRVRYKKLKKEK